MENETQQKELEAAHEVAFDAECCITDDKALRKCQIVKLSELRLEYVKALEETEFKNPQYQPRKLKKQNDKEV